MMTADNKKPARKKHRYPCFKFSSEQDAAIKMAYESGKRGENKRLAYQFGCDRRDISARAAQLGLPSLLASYVKGSAQPWQPWELKILCAHSGEPIAQIRARLYAKSSHRSLLGIRGMLALLRKKGEIPDTEQFYENKGYLKLSAVAAGLGTTPSLVATWIRDGLLRANNPGPGGVIKVHYRDLRSFMIEYVAKWDHRKADRWFMVDVLTNALADTTHRSDREAA